MRLGFCWASAASTRCSRSGQRRRGGSWGTSWSLRQREAGRDSSLGHRQYSVIVNDIKGDLFAQTAGYRRTLGKVFVIDPTGLGHRFDPLLGKHSEDELLSVAMHLLYQPHEGDGAIFTQRATVMLTQLFLAARAEDYPPLPYVRHMIRPGLPAVAARLNAINPDLATQLLDVRFEDATFTDHFLPPLPDSLPALRPQAQPFAAGYLDPDLAAV
jgi:hypothetical protein